MSFTSTARLGLILDNDDDPIDQFIRNWQILDNAAGVIYVSPGVIPSNSILYDGAMVVEKKTGKVWIAQKNQQGTYDQIWVRYPYMFVAQANRQALPGWQGGVYNEWGISVFTTADSINASNADIARPSNRWQAPIDGIYLIHAGYTVLATAASFGGSQIVLSVDAGSWEIDKTEVSGLPYQAVGGWRSSPRTTWQKYFKKGQTVGMFAMIQGIPGGGSTIYSYQTVSMVAAITQ